MGEYKNLAGLGNSGPPSKLLINNKIIESPTMIATEMNNHFLNKIKNMKRKIPSSDEDPCMKLKETMREEKQSSNSSL